MRFFVLPFLLLTGAIPVRDLLNPPRPLVVFVHGRGMIGSDSAQLRRARKGDMDVAFAQAGLPALRDADVRLAWYADVLDPGTEAACMGTGASDTGIGGLTRGFLASLASLVPDERAAENRETRSLLGDVLYLVDPVTRCATETRLGNEVTAARAQKRPLIIVGYSLGSVVAYEYLRKLAPDGSAPVQLVTIGSPLGMPLVREMLLGNFGTLRTPSAVVRWSNIYHPDDALAGPIGGDARIHEVVLTTRASGDPHLASRYLRDAQTASVLAAAMCTASRGRYAKKCSDTAQDRLHE